MKVDYKKDLKHLYSAPAGNAVMVEVPEMKFLMVDGQGDPSPGTGSGFSEATEALYSISYTLKFMIKKESTGTDYSVAPLEGLWWAEDMDVFSLGDRDAWQWTLVIMQPDFVTGEHFSRAVEQVRQKKNPAFLSKVRLERFHEGPVAQILHVGPYATEHPTIEKLHAFIRQNGYALDGKHHEIYLGDPRRSAPEKLKTIIRQPVQKS